MSKEIATAAADKDRTALDLLVATSRFTRTLGRVPGVHYSTVAWRVLGEVSRTPTRISVLAQQQRVAQPTMTALVQRLEGEGWLTRGPDPEDGRATLVAVTDDMLIGVRDPFGIRPLVLGKLGGAYIMTSETCALDIIGAEFVRDIKPGEMVIIDKQGMRTMQPFAKTESRFCK